MGEVVHLERGGTAMAGGSNGGRPRMAALRQMTAGPVGHAGAAGRAPVPSSWRNVEAGGLPARGFVATPRPGTSDGEVPDAAWVVARLEEAGRTLLALPGSGHSTRLRTSNLEIVRTAMAAYGAEVGRVRPPVPSPAHITRMDEAFAWMALIPQDRYVLRRIVGARCLVSPVTDRHLYSWRRLGGLIGADHKAVQRWHAQGVALLVQGMGG